MKAGGRSSPDGKASAYLLMSTEPLLVQEKEEELTAAVVPEETRDLNLLTVYGWEAEIGPLVEFLQTMPFLAERRMLVVREIQKFGDWKMLIDYLKDPNPGSCLLMTSTELRRKDPVFRGLSPLVQTVELKKPYGDRMGRWAVDRFRSLDKEIDPDLAALLVEITGGSMSTLAAEIEKVSLYAGTRARIEPDDLTATIPGGVETVFSLIDAIGEGRWEKAMTCLRTLLDTGSRPEYLVHMLARHYRQLIRARSMVASGTPAGKAAEAQGIRFKGLKEKFTRQLGRVKNRDLIGDMERLAACDRELKTGRLPDDVVLDRLLLDLLA